MGSSVEFSFFGALYVFAVVGLLMAGLYLLRDKS